MNAEFLVQFAEDTTEHIVFVPPPIGSAIRGFKHAAEGVKKTAVIRHPPAAPAQSEKTAGGDQRGADAEWIR